MPIPADTIVGLYHPYRDLFAKNYPNGVPFKNFLITDPVRQQYPWKYLSVEIEKKAQFPIWNPYNLAGTPLLANFQTAFLYPLNILFFFLPFNFAWSILVILQPVLGGIFMYLYLRYMKLSKLAGGLGSFVFSFSGFSIAWMEWNTVLQVLIWLPLILLAKEHLLSKISKTWMIILIFAEVSAIFAGHLQILFYTLILSNLYLLMRIFEINKEKNTLDNFIKKYKVFLFSGTLIFCITLIQWVLTFQLIFYSGRALDQINWQQEGWFVPWQHLIQFFAPDFFGNPATLNYWGIWNYAELVGYISVLPLLLAFYAVFYRRGRITVFFAGVVLTALLFSLPTSFAKLPFLLNIPFISTSQPTRLLGIVSFALAILSALGMDYYLKNKMKYLPMVIFITIYAGLWLYVAVGYRYVFSVPVENILIAKRNLVLPTSILLFSSFLLFVISQIKNKKYTIFIGILLIGLTLYDLFHLGEKFLPFIKSDFLFPSTKTLLFLKKHVSAERIMAIDSRILPPNFSIMYKLPSVEGYDPLYLQRYAELIAASERGRPDINPPFGFNRIITPHNYDSKIIDLLGVKYILSLSELKSSKLKKVFQEGETRVYENSKVLPRAFFVSETIHVRSKKEEINTMYKNSFDFSKVATTEYSGDFQGKLNWQIGNVRILNYSENKIIVQTDNTNSGFLVLTDSYYPTWKIRYRDDAKDEHNSQIYLTDFNFKGIIVPSGKHVIEFYNSLF